MILLIMTSYISVVKIIIFLIDKTLIKIKYYRELVFCFFLTFVIFAYKNH